MTDPQDDLPPGPWMFDRETSPIDDGEFYIEDAGGGVVAHGIKFGNVARAIAAIPERQEHNAFLQKRVITFQNEATRLRAELAEMHQLLEAALADSIDYMDIVEDRNRLRAKEVELRAELSACGKECQSLRAQLNDFTDPNTPGMVSVGLLNLERQTGDRLRTDNDRLRAEREQLRAALWKIAPWELETLDRNAARAKAKNETEGK